MSGFDLMADSIDARNLAIIAGIIGAVFGAVIGRAGERWMIRSGHGAPGYKYHNLLARGKRCSK